MIFMMNNSERMNLISEKVSFIKKRRASRKILFLKASSTVSAVLLIVCIGLCSNAYTSGTVPGSYGSILLVDGAGGYVLTAVSAFAFAAIFTAACINKREKEKQNKKEAEK